MDDDWLEALSTLPDLPSDLDRATAADITGMQGPPSEESAKAGPAIRMRLRRMRSGGNLSELKGATGSPERWLGRIHLKPLSWVQAGGIAEKDPGESARHGFTSAFIRLGRVAGGVSLIIGDYRVQAGSGVLLGRPSFSAPGARLFPRPGTYTGPLKPHASADENRFFRGLAARLPLRLGSWSVDGTLFASSVKRSGRVDASGTFSPYLAGLFRTPSEIERLNTNRERLGGAVVALHREAFRMEIAGLWTGLDHPVLIQSSDGATCRSWAGGSIGAGMAGPGFELSGEVAHSRSTSLTFEGRAMPSHQMTTVVRIQSVQPGFLAPYGVEGSGRSSAGNRTTCVIECLLRPARWASGALTASLISSAEPLASDPMPSTRVRLSGEAELSLTPAWSVVVFTGETRSDGGVTMTDPEGRELRVMREDDRSTIRIQSVVDGGGHWSIRNRWELVSAMRASRGVREHGVLLQTDLKFRVARELRAALRASIFDVNGWGARVYAAEEDVEGAMRIPVFAGRGVRLYALLRWEVVHAMTLSCRYGVTFQDTVQRGLLLESDVVAEERDLSLQLDIVW